MPPERVTNVQLAERLDQLFVVVGANGIGILSTKIDMMMQKLDNIADVQAKDHTMVITHDVKITELKNGQVLKMVYTGIWASVNAAAAAIWMHLTRQ